MYQADNVRCVQAALQLQTRWKVSPEHLRVGLLEVVQRTGLRGRWEVLQSQGPRVVADTGHNAHGLRPVVEQLLQECPTNGTLHAVVGTVADKDPSDVLALLPRDAHYYWVQADLPRALPASALAERAAEFGLRGRVSGPVARGLDEALRPQQNAMLALHKTALSNSSPDDARRRAATVPTSGASPPRHVLQPVPIPVREQRDRRGPIALQGFGLTGAARDNLAHSMAAWRKLHAP
jgi:hypothetical protein